MPRRSACWQDPQGPRPAGARALPARCPPRRCLPPVRAGVLEVAATSGGKGLSTPASKRRDRRRAAGQLDEARRLAADVHRICTGGGRRRPLSGGRVLAPGDARRGGADPRRRAAAERHYANAMALAKDRYGDLSTTRRQARCWRGTCRSTARGSPRCCASRGAVFNRQHDRPAGRAMPRFPAGRRGDGDRPPSSRRSRRSARWRLRLAACGADILCLERVTPRRRDPRRAAVSAGRSSVAPASTSCQATGPRASTAARGRHQRHGTSDHRATAAWRTFEYANLC